MCDVKPNVRFLLTRSENFSIRTMVTSIYEFSLDSVFRPAFDPVSKTNADINCKKRKGTKKLLKKEKEELENSAAGTNDGEVVEVWDLVEFPKDEMPGNYIWEDGQIVKEVGYYSPFGYEIKDKETKKDRARRLKNFTCTDIVHEEGNDLYWPPVPGVEIPPEESSEVVGNMNKPRPVDPEELEKYKYKQFPTLREIDDQFMMPAAEYRKELMRRVNHFNLFDDKD